MPTKPTKPKKAPKEATPQSEPAENPTKTSAQLQAMLAEISDGCLVYFEHKPGKGRHPIHGWVREADGSITLY